MEKEFKELNVGKIKDAQKASKYCSAPDRRSAFLQGFRFARNNLQRQKGIILGVKKYGIKVKH